MCGCVAGQCGTLWSTNGDCPSLWPGPAGLLPGLWLGLQSGSAQPSHSGAVFFLSHDDDTQFHFDLNHSIHLVSLK